jgi:hypothetical protein
VPFLQNVSVFVSNQSMTTKVAPDGAAGRTWLGWVRFASKRTFGRFARERHASVAPMFALLFIPVLGLVGAATDYSRAANTRTKLQASLDAALLAGIRDGSSNLSVHFSRDEDHKIPAGRRVP